MQCVSSNSDKTCKNSYNSVVTIFSGEMTPPPPKLGEPTNKQARKYLSAPPMGWLIR